jgi:hypothetical protein
MKRKIPKSDLPSGQSCATRPLPTCSEAIVDRLAKEIRWQYIERRRAYETIINRKESRYEPGVYWDGGETSKGHRRSSIWKRIAKFCLRNKVDHFDYVQHIFTSPAAYRAPQPNQLLGDNYLRSFQKACCGVGNRSRLRHIREAYEWQLSRLQEKIYDWEDVVEHDTERTYSAASIQRAILGDNELGLTPLFRFCLAMKQGLEDVADYYYGSAILQYLRFPREYRKVWGDMIPPWFHKVAIRCRKALVS